MYWITQKAAITEWYEGENRALPQAQFSVQASLPLGPYDPAYPVALEVCTVGKDAM